MAVTLLRAMPPDVAEQLLGRLDPPVSARLRSDLEAVPGPPPDDDLDAALTEFFDLYRIAERGRLLAPPGAAGEYRPYPPPAKGANGKAADANGEDDQPVDVTDPVAALGRLTTDKLLQVLDGEPPAVTALLLGVLDPPVAAAVLRGLPPDVRAAVAVRYSQPGQRNYPLIQQLAGAVAEKGRRLAEQPSEAAPDARIADLAAMLRGLPRDERLALFEKMNESDPQLSDRVKEKLFRFDDLLKMDDRAVQGVLAQLNLKSIAIALKGSDERITGKVTNNISSRARELLQEEIGLLGSLSSSQIEEARKEVVTLIRQGEEEGRFAIEE